MRSGAVRVIGVMDSETTRRARSLFVRLRCRPGTVRSLLSRGRDAVRAAIDDEDRSPDANH
mgnify:CR=1 FL=1